MTAEGFSVIITVNQNHMSVICNVLSTSLFYYIYLFDIHSYLNLSCLILWFPFPLVLVLCCCCFQN